MYGAQQECITMINKSKQIEYKETREANYKGSRFHFQVLTLFLVPVSSAMLSFLFRIAINLLHLLVW